MQWWSRVHVECGTCARLALHARSGGSPNWVHRSALWAGSSTRSQCGLSAACSMCPGPTLPAACSRWGWGQYRLHVAHGAEVGTCASCGPICCIQYVGLICGPDLACRPALYLSSDLQSQMSLIPPQIYLQIY